MPTVGLVRPGHRAEDGCAALGLGRPRWLAEGVRAVGVGGGSR